jgi:hypothetical protein
MSYYTDERYSVYSEHVTKARKHHHCDACKRTIAPGQLYMRVSMVWDSTAKTVKRCGACQKTHEHLRGLSPGDMWPEEKLDCGLEYVEEWGEKPPEEIARLPLISNEEASELLGNSGQGDEKRRKDDTTKPADYRSETG